MTTAEQIAMEEYPGDNYHPQTGIPQIERAAFAKGYTRGQQDRWSLEDLERIMVHVGIAVAEYDPFPNQVDERDFLANIRDNLAIEYGLVPKPDPSGLVQWTTPHTP
jgi:hypothetical protein